MAREETVKAFAELPGIGESTAETLYDAGFESLAALREATIEDLTAVEGIGVSTAEGILEELEDLAEATSGTPGEKIRPNLDEETKRALKIRDREADARPRFRRQHLGRYKKLEDKWRSPRGQHSKQRKEKRYRSRRPKAGYRGPKKARGLHPSGFEEVLVHRPQDLDEIDPDTQAARIAGGVGERKRSTIVERADDLGIRVLNPGSVV